MGILSILLQSKRCNYRNKQKSVKLFVMLLGNLVTLLAYVVQGHLSLPLLSRLSLSIMNNQNDKGRNTKNIKHLNSQFSSSCPYIELVVKPTVNKNK